MPQRTQHCLVHILLLWITVLSIMQVMFIIFYFTFGRQQFPSDHELLSGKGKMMTFQATQTKWLAKNPDDSLVSEGDVLTVKKDGYYFLNLQVTLYSCVREHSVILKWNNQTLLKGFLNTTLCSTGLLGKVEELSAGGTLEVTITPEPSEGINIIESETHLDIIYMLKP